MAQCIQMPPYITVCLQGWGRHGWSSSQPVLNFTGFPVCACFTAPRSNKKKKMAEGVICLTAHQTEASCFCCRGAASCLHWGFGESLCSQFPPSCFFFSCPPLHSPPVESKFFSHNHSFLERLILKKLFFHSPSLWAQSLTFCSRSRKVMLDLT